MEIAAAESKGEDSSENGNADATLADALAKLSLTTELDSALLDHLNILDKYMFHMECLSQLFRMVLKIKCLVLRRHFLSLLRRTEISLLQGEVELEKRGMTKECKLQGECRSSEISC
jgi:hypothetical protein